MTSRTGFASLLFVLGVVSSLAVGCGRGDDDDSAAAGSAGSSGGGGSSAGGSGGSNSGGSSGSNAGGSSGSSNAGSAGSGGSGNKVCTAQAGYEDVTVKDINNKSGPKGDLANIDGGGSGAFVLVELMATTPKYLVSKSKSSDTCLWGFFAIQKSGVPEEYASILVVGEGAPQVSDPADPTKTICPEEDGSAATGDVPEGAGWIPNDLGPGDYVTVGGFVTEFPFASLTATCMPEAPTQPQRQIKLPDDGCFTRGTGKGTVTYKEFSTPEEINALTTNDGVTQQKWGGTPIKINGPFTATQSDPANYGAPTDAVSKYGEIYLNEVQLPVVNDVLYGQVLTDGDHSYDYPLTTSFQSFQGIYYLNFCNWTLSTTIKCGDIDPAAADCP